MSPFWLSLKVSTLSTALSVIFGGAIAYLLAKSRFPGRNVVEAITVLPLILPPTVLGYYLLVALGHGSFLGRIYHWTTGHDLVFSWQGAVVAASVASVPLFIRQAQLTFSNIDPHLEEAARNQGASELQAFRYVLLPLAQRGLIAGAVMTFARALGDFGATLIVAGDIPGRTQTMSLAIYDAVYYSNGNGSATGLVLLLTAVGISVALLAARMSGEVGG